MSFGSLAEPAVAVGDVEVAVRAEADRAAVVVPERPFVVLSRFLLASPGRLVGVVLADPEARHDVLHLVARVGFGV